jgi:hypothetical protein
MKLMFNKNNFEGRWFEDEDYPDNWTEKVPPNTGYIFDDKKNEWVEKEWEQDN